MRYIQALALVPVALAAPAAHVNNFPSPYSTPTMKETTATVTVVKTVVAGKTMTYTYPIEPTPSKPSITTPTANTHPTPTPSLPSTPVLPTTTGTTPTPTPSSPSSPTISKPTISATSCLASTSTVTVTAAPTSISGIAGLACSKIIPDAISGFVNPLLQQLHLDAPLTMEIEEILAVLTNILVEHCPSGSFPNSPGFPGVTVAASVGVHT